MIIPNATVEYGTPTGGGTNEAGIPEPVKMQWGEPIRAQVQVNYFSNVGRTREGEAFRAARYHILIPLAKSQPHEHLRLTLPGRHPESYPIQSSEPLPAVGLTLITV